MQTETTELRELRVRYVVKKDSEDRPIVVGRSLITPGEAAAAIMAVLADEPSEVFVIFCLSTKRASAFSIML